MRLCPLAEPLALADHGPMQSGSLRVVGQGGWLVEVEVEAGRGEVAPIVLAVAEPDPERAMAAARSAPEVERCRTRPRVGNEPWPILDATLLGPVDARTVARLGLGSGRTWAMQADPRGPADAPAPSRDIADLVAIMAALRTPGTGCPWDLEQTFATIAPYTIEEAYEVADAVARNDLADLRDELGDLLLQVVFHARMAEEAHAFAFPDVVEAITAKLIRRHPHVFGAARDLSPEEVKGLWDEIKRAEKRERAERRGETAATPPTGTLDGVPANLPALTRADKMTRKAAAVGFTWATTDDVVDKIDEELAETRAAIRGGDRKHMAEELGDLLFTIANLARHLDLDPEAALAAANRKFERRFRAVEARLAADARVPAQSDLAEMDRLWTEAKLRERAG